MKNYIIYHCHTSHSNATTTLDSITTYKDYINKAKECGMNMIGFSEHGNILEWYNKKKYCEENDLRYIHAIEAYITKDFSEKIRDNYHFVLIAKNYNGFLELNKLISKSFNRAEIKIIDNVERFYYSPRISFDELFNTSKNIIITTACMANVLNNSDEIELQHKLIKFIENNKDRCFLEIQHHNVEDQKKYNKKLLNISKAHKINLIAGTDTHSLNEMHLEGRKILQKAKNIRFENEDDFDLNFKTYDELVKSYKIQNSIPENEYMRAIDNTNLLYDIIEDFSIDRSIKYPGFSNQPEKDVIKIIESSNRYDKDNQLLKQRIDLEMEAYKENNAFNLLLLEHDVKKFARENNIPYGDSRGSIAGSQVAYIMKITNSNALKHNYNFERFMNKERVSIADIDTDWHREKRYLIKEYLHNHKKYHTSEIITFNTIADKGAIRDVGRALEISLEEINQICKDFDNEDIEKYKNKYSELFRLVDIIKGTIVSIGSHPAATICSPISLDDNIGLITLSTSKYPVSCLNMKEIDYLNFTKVDVLGLVNIGIISETCELAGIDILTSDNINDDDQEVWQDIKKDPLGIFQFESQFAHTYLCDLLRDDVMNKIKNKVPNINKISLMSIANGAIRPAGESYRNALSNGEFKDHNNEQINEFLKDTLGHLVFQEQIINFLYLFCGFTKGEADKIRRQFAKKEGTEESIPVVKNGFIKTMKSKFDMSFEKSEVIIKDFLQVILDASSYVFSYNHAQPYSYIGYICAYLRYHYEIEFLTTLLNFNRDKLDKTKLIFGYINKHTKIEIKPVKFRYSRSKYFYDKNDYIIYNGTEAIKDLDFKTGETLYSIKDIKFDTFVDFLVYSMENLSINKTKIENLIKLNFFIEFGQNKKLLNIYDEFKNGKYKYVKKNTQKTKDKKIENLKIIENSMPDVKFTIKEQIEFEIELLNVPTVKFGDLIDKRTGYVLDVDTRYSPKIKLYGLNSGNTIDVKINKDIFEIDKLKKGDIIKIIKGKNKPRYNKIDGKWYKIDNEFEYWVEKYIIRKDLV